jgi:hypothetical protein
VMVHMEKKNVSMVQLKHTELEHLCRNMSSTTCMGFFKIHDTLIFLEANFFVTFGSHVFYQTFSIL